MNPHAVLVRSGLDAECADCPCAGMKHDMALRTLPTFDRPDTFLLASVVPIVYPPLFSWLCVDVDPFHVLGGRLSVFGVTIVAAHAGSIVPEASEGG